MREAGTGGSRLSHSVTVLDLGRAPDVQVCLRLLAQAGHGCWFDREATGEVSLLMVAPDQVIRSAAELRREVVARAGESDPGPFGFAGGWAGYLTYEFGLRQIGVEPPHPLWGPVAALEHYSACLAIDNRRRRAFAVGRGEVGRAEAKRLAARLEQARRQAQLPSPPCFAPPRVLEDGPDPERFTDQVRTVKRWIRAGDAYVANLTYRIRMEPLADPASAYATLRAAHTAPYAALVRDGSRWILSSSPELLLARHGARTWTRPIKGTRPAAVGSGELLVQDPKERAELTMIVDLERNDLGQVAEPGSVRVSELFALERHPGIEHLLATVEASVPGPAAALLLAMLPGGSVTGAPKRRVCELLSGLEADARGVYTGTVGWCDDGGDMEWNVAIRTLEATEHATYYGTGGGITIDSLPAREYLETRLKARGPLRALGVALD